ncbi:tyrosine-type recombinase/integrase [Agrobacterium sp. BA1120]|uniref:tyrosine-type recombinase/integrase n=1 Tax=Agrobacterium sp. BA1120 TaxID=3228927 RepID=UPI00336A666D
MMIRKHLHDELIDTLPFSGHSEKRSEIYDASIPNLAIRVGARTKNFILVARFGGGGDTTRRILGRFPTMNTETARKEAHRWNNLLQEGINPATVVEKEKQAEELRNRSTFEAAMLDYLAYIPSRPRNLSVATETYNIRRYILDPRSNPWLYKPISEVDDLDVASLIGEIKNRTPAMAFQVFRLLKTFFRWAIGPEYRRLVGLEHNPIEYLRAKSLGLRANERDRVFEYEEARAYLKAATATPYPYGPCLRVLIETGQRIGVVSAMRWSQVNLERKLWIIPGGRSSKAKPGLTSKGDEPHKVPLSNAVVDLLKAIRAMQPEGHGDFVFSYTGGQTRIRSFSNLRRDKKSSLDREIDDVAPGRFDKLMRDTLEAEALEYEPWVWHDVRRTCRTHLEAITGRTEVAEAAIGHGKSGVVRIYNLHKYRPEIRKAFEAWSMLLQKVESGNCTIADWEHDLEATWEPVK